ncbi:cold shock domain-containing protein [Gemmatimonas sp.]|uniref:cold shock domain-containing protein n=1 Tax=Gemmatimonas sp. TaxID=1962908 RepID=UPI003564BAA8
MSFFIATLTFPPGDHAGAVVIVDVDARRVETLWSAGADPVPMNGQTADLIDKLMLKEPADLVGAETTNLTASIGELASYPSRAEALEAADRVLAKAQGGVEHRTEVPSDIARHLRGLIFSLENFRAQVNKLLDEIDVVARNGVEALSRPITLQDRRTGQEGSEPSDYTEVLRLLEVVTNDEPTKDSVSGTGTVRSASEPRLFDSALSSRVVKALRVAGIQNVDDLIKLTRAQVRGIPNIGREAMKEIDEALIVWDMTLKRRTSNALGHADTGAAAPLVPNRPKSKRRHSIDDRPAVRRNGHIKSFDFAKGFGFIVPDGETNDVFLHISEFQTPVKERPIIGELVTFETEQDLRGPRAKRVRRQGS